MPLSKEVKIAITGQNIGIPRQLTNSRRFFGDYCHLAWHPQPPERLFVQVKKTDGNSTLSILDRKYFKRLGQKLHHVPGRSND